MTLTWSIAPDGTFIPQAFAGIDPPANSTLIAFFNSIYGSMANWLPLFQQVFDRWGELIGVTYVYEPNDDGAAFFNAGGQLGVRGDVRIGGKPIDGNSNILAYNFFPNGGDMVIDSPDSFFNNTSNNSLNLRNVVAHEHGHGLGISHVCPVNQTKLMEPFVSSAFDGPQHDDILGANRHYGDIFEDNDSSGTAAGLGTLNGSLTIDQASVDDNSDIDFFGFDVSASTSVDVAVAPIGFTYLQGPQNSNGSCTPAPRSIPRSSKTCRSQSSTATVPPCWQAPTSIQRGRGRCWPACRCPAPGPTSWKSTATPPTMSSSTNST